MKHLLTITAFMFLGMSAHAQSSWFATTSCSAHGAAIADKALDALINVERPMAIGMAKASLLIDEGCGIAKLVLANASGDSKQRLLEEAGASNLSADEALWHELDLNRQWEVNVFLRAVNLSVSKSWYWLGMNEYKYHSIKDFRETTSRRSTGSPLASVHVRLSDFKETQEIKF